MLSNIDIRTWEQCHTKLGKLSANAYSAVCDVCGGSSTNPNQKKLYLYSRNGKSFVRCFHGSCEYSATLEWYLKEHHPNLLNQYIAETKGSALKNLFSHLNEDDDKENNENFNNELETVDWGYTPLDTESTISNTPDSNTLSTTSTDLELYDLNLFTLPLSEVPVAVNYIHSRGLEVDPTWRYAHQNMVLGGIEYNIAGSIIIPLLKDNLWYGFYSRAINRKSFMTFIPDKNQEMKIWNWFNINLEEDVYIFESIFDAISSGKSNIIATLGTTLPLSKERLIKHKVWCYDNDKAGVKSALNKASESDKVLIFPDEYNSIKDLNTFLQKGIFNKEELTKFVDNNIADGIVGLMKLKLK